eukprot:366251-Chlamydomonas_euryale.AAC.13
MHLQAACSSGRDPTQDGHTDAVARWCAPGVPTPGLQSRRACALARPRGRYPVPLPRPSVAPRKPLTDAL